MIIIFFILPLVNSFIQNIIINKYYNKYLIKKKYDYLFNEISDKHYDIINNLNMTKIVKRNDLSFMNNNNIELENYYYQNEHFRKVRLTYFYSNDIQSFNSIWYPSYNYDAPILSVDVVFYDYKILCYINLVEIYNTYDYRKQYINTISKFKNKYPNKKMKFDFLMNGFNSEASFYNKYTISDYNSNNSNLCILFNDYFNESYNNFIIKPVNRFYIEEKQLNYNKFRKNIEATFTKQYFKDNDWYDQYINFQYSNF